MSHWHGTACKRGYSLSEENTPFRSPRERRGESPSTPDIAGLRLEELHALRNRVPAGFPATRFELLLSSLSLCLRIVTLMQSPPTSDLCRLAFACRGGIAALAALLGLSVDGNQSAPKQDTHRPFSFSGKKMGVWSCRPQAAYPRALGARKRCPLWASKVEKPCTNTFM